MLQYLGCIEVLRSMRSLDFTTRSQITRYAPNRNALIFFIYQDKGSSEIPAALGSLLWFFMLLVFNKLGPSLLTEAKWKHVKYPEPKNPYRSAYSSKQKTRDEALSQYVTARVWNLALFNWITFSACFFFLCFYQLTNIFSFFFSYYGYSILLPF